MMNEGTQVRRGQRRTAVDPLSVGGKYAGRVTIADRPDQNPKYVWDDAFRHAARQAWEALRLCTVRDVRPRVVTQVEWSQPGFVSSVHAGSLRLELESGSRLERVTRGQPT